MEVTVFTSVRDLRARSVAPSWQALHSHTCAHKYTARVLTISTGYAAPSCERLGRYVVTMKGVAFEDEKLSPVRFILPLAVARYREWRTFLDTGPPAPLKHFESSFLKRTSHQRFRDNYRMRRECENQLSDLRHSATFLRVPEDCD